MDHDTGDWEYSTAPQPALVTLAMYREFPEFACRGIEIVSGLVHYREGGHAHSLSPAPLARHGMSGKSVLVTADFPRYGRAEVEAYVAFTYQAHDGARAWAVTNFGTVERPLGPQPGKPATLGAQRAQAT